MVSKGSPVIRFHSRFHSPFQLGYCHLAQPACQAVFMMPLAVTLYATRAALSASVQDGNWDLLPAGSTAASLLQPIPQEPADVLAGKPPAPAAAPEGGEQQQPEPAPASEPAAAPAPSGPVGVGQHMYGARCDSVGRRRARSKVVHVI